MKIVVTAEDIKKGAKKNKCLCPVALAIRRATGRAVAVLPMVAWIKHYWPTQMISYPLPQVAQDFILNFDEGEDVEPFEFEVGEGRTT